MKRKEKGPQILTVALSPMPVKEVAADEPQPNPGDKKAASEQREEWVIRAPAFPVTKRRESTTIYRRFGRNPLGKRAKREP